MKIKKLNIKKLLIFLISIITFIILGVMLINNIKYKKTSEYKLLELGYNLEEIKVLQKELNADQLNEILEYDYNTLIPSFCKETYFIFKNLQEYLEYQKVNKTLEYSKVVAIVNTEANEVIYENVHETVVSKGFLMLVNKRNGVTADYVPEDLINIPVAYAYEGKQVSKSIYNNLVELLEAAKKEGITFVVSEGYRSYERQEISYNYWKNMYGIGKADTIAARAGYSEYQTGLSVTLQLYGNKLDNEVVEESTQNKWLIKNMSSYGFILRYPQNKEDITGFDYNAWRIRYVGSMAATYIMSNNITFEEYYAFYEEN